MVYKTLKTKGIPFRYKDGFGAGNSATENVVPNNVVHDKDSEGNEETYIPVKDNKKLAMNKILHTKVGDDIHYYQNGVEGRGIVVKMSNEYVMVAKEDGDFQDIHINDTFFVKDIVVNKTWDNMNPSERGEVLVKAHAPSTRFVTKNWYELPRELQEVLTKQTGSTQEAGASRDDETRTYRDQDKSLAANNSTVKDDTFVKGYGSEAKEQTDDDGQSLPDFKQQKAKLGQNCVSCGKKLKKSDVEHGDYGNVNTDTPLDVSESTGYEEREHMCVECIGQLPREEAKPHGANEIEEGKHGDKVKEPHQSKDKGVKENLGKKLRDLGKIPDVYPSEIKGSEQKDKSEQFRKIYGGGKKKLKKGVPEWNVNTWGINYTVKEDGEEEETV